MADLQPKQRLKGKTKLKKNKGTRSGKYYLASYAYNLLADNVKMQMNSRPVTRSMETGINSNSALPAAVKSSVLYTASKGEGNLKVTTYSTGNGSHIIGPTPTLDSNSENKISKGLNPRAVERKDDAGEGLNTRAVERKDDAEEISTPDVSLHNDSVQSEDPHEEHTLGASDDSMVMAMGSPSSSVNPPPSYSGNKAQSTTFQQQVKTLGNCINQVPTEIGDLIMQTLNSLDNRLKKLDTLESMSVGLRGDFEKIHAKIGTLSSQMLGTKADLEKAEKKWEEDSMALKGRMQKVENGCQKIEKAWNKCKVALHKDLNVVQSTVKENSSKILEIEKKLDEKGGQTAIDKNSSKILELEKKIAEMKGHRESFTQFQAKIETVTEDKFQVLQETIREDMKREVKGEMAAKQQEQEADQAFKKMKDQAYARRRNLLIFGIPENMSTEQDYDSVSDFFSNKMGIETPHIEVLYRLGSPKRNRNRPIVVTFSNIQDRWDIWKRRRDIIHDPQCPTWIQEDLPGKLRQDNRVLLRIIKTAKSRPDFAHDIRIQDFQLVFNGTKYGINDLHRLPREISTKMAFTPYSDEAVAFFTKHSPLSNHFPCSFVVDNISYNCVEQYLAVQRAYLAKNKSLARKAMGTKNPAEHKNILNQLRNDQPDTWKENAQASIITALRAKFNQNKVLAHFLMDTYPRQIGEASKNETWGIGLSLDSKDVLDTTKWRKEGNLLGTSLEKIRAELMAAQYVTPQEKEKEHHSKVKK